MSVSLLRVKEFGGVADQCRDLGVAVGETIVGREGGGGDWWHEARLTLLWLGQEEAVWSVQSRTNVNPDWSEPREEVNWTLECREWRKTPMGRP